MVLFVFYVCREKPVYRVGEEVTVIFEILNNEDETVFINGINNPLPLGIVSGVKLIECDGRISRDILIPSFEYLESGCKKIVEVSFRFLKEGSYRFSPQLLVRNRKPIASQTYTFNVSGVSSELGIRRVGSRVLIKMDDWIEDNRGIVITLRFDRKFLDKFGRSVMVKIALEEAYSEAYGKRIEEGVYGSFQDFLDVVGSVSSLEGHVEALDFLSRIFLGCLFSPNRRECLYDVLEETLIAGIEDPVLREKLKKGFVEIFSKLEDILKEETLFVEVIDDILYLCFKEDDILMILGYFPRYNEIKKIVLAVFLESKFEAYDFLAKICERLNVSFREVNGSFVLLKTYEGGFKKLEDIQKVLISFENVFKDVLKELLKAVGIKLSILSVDSLRIEQIRKLLVSSDGELS